MRKVREALNPQADQKPGTEEGGRQKAQEEREEDVEGAGETPQGCGQTPVEDSERRSPIHTPALQT